MKTMLAILFALTISTSAQFTFTNIFTGATSGDGTGDRLYVAGGKINTNLYFITNSIGIVSNAAVTASNALQASIIASNASPAAPVVTFTNWVSGLLYTNLSGRPWWVHGMADLTPAAVLGTVGMFLQVGNQGAGLVTVGGHGFQTILGTLVMTNTIEINGTATNGAVFTFTNLSSGAGNSAILQPGAGHKIQY